MSSRNERSEAICTGMSARIVTPDSPLPDLLEEFGSGHEESEMKA